MNLWDFGQRGDARQPPITASVAIEEDMLSKEESHHLPLSFSSFFLLFSARNLPGRQTTWVKLFSGLALKRADPTEITPRN